MNIPQNIIEFIATDLVSTKGFSKDAMLKHLKGTERKIVGLRKRLESYQIFESVTLNDKNKILEIIVDVINDYIKQYPSPIYYKENLRNRFYLCCEELSGKWNIKDGSNIINNLDHVISEPTILVIKALHNPKGITKEAIADMLNVSKKTVQNAIHKLAAKSPEDSVKIGGIPVRSEIVYEDKDDGDFIKGDKERYQKRRYYHMPNTIHPLCYQYNLTQTAILLKSLYKSYYDDDSFIAYDMALDTWCQLSEYAQNRIKLIFGEQDKGFKEFLNDLENEYYEHVRVFNTEEDIISSKDASNQELLIMAYKTNMTCRITLKNPKRILYNQHVFYDAKSNEYYCTDGKSEKIKVKSEDLFDIVES